MFNEDTFEKMVCDTLKNNGWKYIPADDLPRQYSDALVEPMVKDALIRLNPCIAKDPTRADEVIYKLRTLILSVQPNNLVAQNEEFKKLVFENNSFPFGKNGRMVPIKFFGSLYPEEIAKNEYVVTNQWVYPKAEGGKRLDIVLLINGFPIAIGELKTPVREAISWMDGAADILAYEKSIPQMFVTNVFNFASEGKCYRYGSVNAPLTVWGPWHTNNHKDEGTLASVQTALMDMIQPDIIMDIFRFFTVFAREGSKKVTSYTPKLILQDQYENRADFESILAENNIIDFRKKPNYRGLRRIEKAYKHFKKCIDQHIEKSIEENPDLLETDVLFELAQKFKSVVLVGIEVDTHKDAYMLFESLNHRGVPLSAIDLIKNILIAKADEYGLADKCYNQWKEALDNIGSDYSVQERFMRQYYNAFREELNTPFLSEDTSKRFPLAYKATRTTLLDIYEKLIRKDYEQFMKDFMAESAYYSIIVNNSEEKKLYAEELADLERIQGAPSYLLLLYLLTKEDELKITDDDIKSIIIMLIKFFVRRNVTDIPATRNLDRIFMDIVAAIKGLQGQAVCQEIKNNLMEESASDDIFDLKLRGPMYEENDMATRFVLCGIESLYQTREIYSDFWSRNKSGVYVWTIEHIFPEGQNIPEEWVKMIADGDKTLADNYRETYVHTLGNLTLTGYNQNLSNMSFKKKKDRMDKSNSKYIGYRNGLVLNEDVVSEETWTVDKIKERTNKLVEIIKNIYSW